MKDDNHSQLVFLFRSIFRGRDDVFAIRWEKGNKNGYMPAYTYDPYHYRTHKMNGGTFQSYPNKSYLSISDTEIQKHLDGIQQIGIYPLLKDDTSWFLVADFDKKNWKQEATDFIKVCKEKNIYTYLERSRSGNGGHVWIFFEEPYPAIRSRKIFISILEKIGSFSIFDKSSSFDRLFPNQDFLSGKGLGNLIALPLYKEALDKGNSCFVDSETFEPISNQWLFLKNIKRNSIERLDGLYKELSASSDSYISKSFGESLIITLDSELKITRTGLTTLLINFIKEELNFANSEFFIKKKSGKNTFGTERYFNLIEETENEIIVPKGFVGKFIRFCRESKTDFKFIDKRLQKPPINFVFTTQLRSYQQKVISDISKKDFGVLVSPPASGKTVIALKIIAEKKQPTLIIVHRKQLLEQWLERVEAFLGIPKQEIGIIGQGKTKIGKQITVATIQSIHKQIDTLQNYFGMIIVDECHHIPAETFRKAIGNFKSFYLYGLTATPFRKHNDDKLIFAYLGDIIANILPIEIEDYKQAKIIIRNTNLNVPFNSKTDNFETLSKILIHDSSRNKLILNDVKTEVNQGKKVVIITERKEHLDTLYLFLKPFYEIVTLSGDDTENNRKYKWNILKDGTFQVLITTGQYFGEGTDLQNINCLFLVYPFSFKGKAIQYIGRVQRSEINPIIYDYRDIKIDYLNKLFLKRNTYYRKINKQSTLFDEPKEEIIPSNPVISVERKIKVLIENLDFHYGSVTFNYFVEEINTNLEFSIENLEILPEFEILKPYFIKALKSKTISIVLFAEFENGRLVSQLATSDDIERINKELIEGVKFQFLNKNLIEKPFFKGKNVLTADELQNHQGIYPNAENILQNILNSKNYKHSLQIQYLADKHESSVMKIRFVLSPFSFVFLITGKHYYHIVLETLDTEEASYIWHVIKSKEALIKTVDKIDSQLNIIKEHGRQIFLETNPQHFSRIIHNYSEDRKGFIMWKNSLEELIM
ncbi:TOTE conflict system archaeo-eukaryotic primase domain-containing protein [Chryseobacterium sp. MYb328]|uniref:TOTE conflict system archaeo-eukaryotic primase domain-containing protein n=1 Tax=Chryseobacterium sp. MYb328 TaxID=2745231 RepID=UPI0030A9E1F1